MFVPVSIPNLALIEVRVTRPDKTRQTTHPTRSRPAAIKRQTSVTVVVSGDSEARQTALGSGRPTLQFLTRHRPTLGRLPPIPPIHSGRETKSKPIFWHHKTTTRQRFKRTPPHQSPSTTQPNPLLQSTIGSKKQASTRFRSCTSTT